MYLVWFLTIGSLIALLTGEFGHYPFGGGRTSVSLLDLLIGLTCLFGLIWNIGIRKKIELPTPFKLIMAFWVIGLISLIWSRNLNGGLYLIRFVLYSSSFWISYQLVKQKIIKLPQFIVLIIKVLVVFAMLGFLQLLILPNFNLLTDFGFDPHQNRLASSFLDPNFAGVILNIGILLSVYQWMKTKKIFFPVAALILLVALILTFSRSAYLMLAIEILIFGLFRMRKLLLVLFLVGVLSYLFVPRFSDRIQGALSIDKSASERIDSWREGLEVFKTSPVFGVGFNNLRYAYEKNNLVKTYTDDGGHSGAGVDSSLILVLATTGVIGLLIYLTFWVYLFKSLAFSAWYKKSDISLVLIAILVGLFLNSQFINSLFYPPIMIILYLLLGVSYASNLED